MKTTDIYLTSQEAQSGCQRVVSLPGQASPLKLNLEPGTRNNTKLVVKNARFYDKNGNITMIPVKVTVHVEQVKNVNAATQKRKGGHGFFKMMAVIYLIGLIGMGIAFLTDGNRSRTSPNPSAGSGTGTTSSVRTDTPSSSGQQGSSNAPGQSYTDIPALLLQEGWSSFGAPEYCPKFEFFTDGRFNMWINWGSQYEQAASNYEVYLYSDGLRTIVCDVSTISLYAPLWNKIYLVESEQGVWNYCGTPVGFSDISCRFVASGSGTVSVPAASVRDINLSTKYVWMTENYENDLSFNWVDSGKLSFNLGLYRMGSYENQSGFRAPDGAVYSFLNGVENTGASQADGLVRLTFQEHGISLEFLAAVDSADVYLKDYVGQTYLFPIGEEIK